MQGYRIGIKLKTLYQHTKMIRATAKNMRKKDVFTFDDHIDAADNILIELKELMETVRTEKTDFTKARSEIVDIEGRLFKLVKKVVRHLEEKALQC